MSKININKPYNLAKSAMASASKQGNSSRYTLITKTEELPAKDLKLDFDKWRMGGITDAEYYTHVKVGKKDDPEFNREILTLFDSNHNMIRRFRIGNNVNYQKRDYKYSLEFPEIYPLIPRAMRKHIKVTEWFDSAKRWRPVLEEDQFVYNIEKISKKNARKLHINKNVYDYTDDKTKIYATMTEYPTNFGLEPQSAKKFAGVEIELENNLPKVTTPYNTVNVKLPKNDKFLPFRFLLEEQKQISLGHNFLKEEGVDNLGIKIKVSPNVVSGNSSGHFDSYYGNIWLKEIFRKTHPVGIVAHEADHAKRYAIIGQLGKQRTPYEQKAENVLGPITNPEEAAKGYEYLLASENYPALKPDENLRENKEYWNNKLEVLARKKEEDVKKKYMTGRKTLQNQFKYIAGENTL